MRQPPQHRFATLNKGTFFASDDCLKLPALGRGEKIPAIEQKPWFPNIRLKAFQVSVASLGRALLCSGSGLHIEEEPGEIRQSQEESNV